MELTRYLESKRRVDDRALNRSVWNRLQRELAEVGAKPLRVLDVGAGIGSGLERMEAWGLFPPHVEVKYTGIDVEPAHVERARHFWNARAAGSTGTIRAQWLESALSRFAAEAKNQESFELVTAHAFLDVVPLEPSVSALSRLCVPGGLVYCPITFDGETAFEPSHPLDESVIGRYHDSMRANGGDPRTGRRLAALLSTPPLELLELGGSDWVVYPTRSEGLREPSYRDDEAFFLCTIVRMVERELGDDEARRWAEERRRQIDAKELYYFAHQLDALARKRET